MLYKIALAASLGLAAALPQQSSQMIIGGVEAKPGELPYVVSLGDYNRPSLDWHICGGVLLSPTIVLTAAHCGERVAPDHVFVRAGSLSIIEGGVIVNVTSIRNHPLFRDTAALNHDIAVWELSEPLTEGPDILYIELPTQDSDPEAGEMTTVSGWGFQSVENFTYSEELRKVDVPIVSREECAVQYEDHVSDVTDNMICAGYKKGGKDACVGDSGGPQVDSTGVLVGLVSWGNMCALPGYPGVYTRVGNYIEWIAETISKRSR